MALTSNLAQRLVYTRGVSLGCDPELFLTSKGGYIIGSERVIPEEGLADMPYKDMAYYTPVQRKFSRYKTVRDGVQIELNPNPSTCRQSLAGEISGCFMLLNNHLLTLPHTKVTFRALVTVRKKELDGLSEKSRLLGCAPSKNLYDPGASITIDPFTYRKRSAGGHIHLGLLDYTQRPLPADRLCALMDILVGNTCVLIDRDPHAIERRKVYGRAGEYREPSHGFEYRTLSNFWLKHYHLMSFVMGLSRLAVQVLDNTVAPKGYNGWRDAESALLSLVDMQRIKKAINTNNLALAAKNFEGVRHFIDQHVPRIGSGGGLESDSLPAFDYFCQKVAEKGLDYWFPADPLTHWLKPNLGGGWESFLSKRVATELAKGTTPTPPTP